MTTTVRMNRNHKEALQTHHSPFNEPGILSIARFLTARLRRSVLGLTPGAFSRSNSTPATSSMLHR